MNTTSTAANPAQKSIRLAVFGPNLRDQSKGQFVVHTADCADCKKLAREHRDDGNYTDALHVSRELYADMIAEESMTADDGLQEIYFAPCVKFASETDEPALAVQPGAVAPAIRAGTQTGSLLNHVISGCRMAVPVIGMGATMLCWTDRHAATVTVITSPKRIGVVQDVATRTDKNGMSESQSYDYSPGTGAPQFFTLRKNGAWVLEGESMKNGQRLAIGNRDEYHDFSF